MGRKQLLYFCPGSTWENMQNIGISCKVQSVVCCCLCSWSSCEFPVTQTWTPHSIDSLVSLATAPVQNLGRTDQNLGCYTSALYKAVTSGTAVTSDSWERKCFPAKCDRRSCAVELLRLAACSLLGEKQGPPLVLFFFNWLMKLLLFVHWLF